MKKVIFVMLAIVGMVNAQSWTDGGSTGNGLTAIRSLVAWTPFANDSVGIQVSNPLDISGVDSIHVWSSAISANGTAHLTGAFRAGFASTFATTTSDSLASVIDTTNSKLETLNYYSVIYPKGAAFAFVYVNPKSGGTGTGNFYTLRKDAILNINFRLYYGKQTTAR